tara:strand:+ start:7174 stop:7449 length:276 start_codon:yes stop_codon:yes gene_type:complete
MLKIFRILTFSAFAVLSATSLEVLADSKSNYTTTYDMKCPDGKWKHTWKKIEGHYHSCTNGYQGDDVMGSEKNCTNTCAESNSRLFKYDYD